MGNCQCRPREDGESLKEFLARKFHNISGKRKIDDHVTIAIHDEREKSGLTRDVVETGKADEEDNQMEAMELLDLEDITDSEDEHSLDSDGRTSSNQRQLDQCEMSADLDEKTEYDEQEKLSRQDVFEPKEDNDQIRVLQHQLQQVQDQLANLQRGKSSSGESMNTCTDKGESMNTCTDKGESMNTCTDKGESSGVHSFLSQQLDEIEEMPALPECETYNHVETIRHRTHRERFLHAQGDTRDSMDEQLNDEYMEMTTVTGVKEVNGTKTGQITSDDKGDAGVKDDGRTHKNYRRNKMHGMITEGLRTRTSVNIPRNKILVSRKECTHYKKAAKETNTVLDKTKVAAKIAALQKRDPTFLGPDKGIVWPKTMDNLSKADKAYYVDQFLRSEFFRQRCLRKYQGSKTWMNGLSPFQLWVLENEDSAEIEAVLHPFPKRQNKAQAKVKCWRGETPPPSPSL